MKKSYNKPTTNVVRIQPVNMIAASTPSTQLFGKSATGAAMSKEDEEVDEDLW